MLQLILGAAAMAGFFMLKDYANKNAIQINWWQWLLTILGIIYTVFVLEVIIGFLAEGEPQAALVMGLITGIAAVIWGVLLGRFVFKPAS